MNILNNQICQHKQIMAMIWLEEIQYEELESYCIMSKDCMIRVQVSSPIMELGSST